MSTRLVGKLFRRLSNPDLSVRQRSFLWMCSLAGAVVLLFFLPEVFIVGLPTLVRLTFGFTGIFFIGLFVLAATRGHYLYLISILCALLLFNLSWLYMEGVAGTTLLYLFVIPISAVLFCNGWVRWAVHATFLINVLTLLAIEALHPEMITPYSSRTSRFLDLSVSIPIAATLCFCIAWFIVFCSRMEENKLRALNSKLFISEADASSLIACAPLGICRSMIDGKLISANPAMVEMLGYKSEKELVGINLTSQIYLDEHQRFSLVKNVLENGHANNQIVRWKRADGRNITVRLHARRLPDQMTFETFVEDISQHLALEDHLRQAQKMEAIGRLAGGVAHDFNNLLTAIRVSAELAQYQLEASPAEWERMQDILDACDRGAGLTNQMLAFSRRQMIAPTVIDMNALVTQTSSMLRRLLGEDVLLKLELGEELWKIKADLSQLVQVLMNLSVNARDAMPQGGTLTIQTRNIEIDSEITAQNLPPGDYMAISVRDTGNGVPEGVKPFIFEPFFTTKAIDKGTGLGLSTVYGIAQQHGGGIWVESESGKGSCFTVCFPRVLSDTERKTIVAEKAARDYKGTLLLVEDELQLRESLRDLLAHSGFHVLTAGSGEEAIAHAKGHDGTISVLVTDVVMPRMSGRQLAEVLLQKLPDLRILFISGYSDDSLLRHGIREDGVAFLQKPFNSETLLRKIQEVLVGVEA